MRITDQVNPQPPAPQPPSPTPQPTPAPQPGPTPTPPPASNPSAYLRAHVPISTEIYDGDRQLTFAACTADCSKVMSGRIRLAIFK